MKLMLRTGRPVSVLITAALMGAGCGAEEPDLGVTFETADVKETSQLALVIERASEELGVPADVLKSVIEVETGFVPSVGEVEFEHQEPTYGLFALRSDELRQAADLLDEDVEIVKTDDEANIRAGAALLREYAVRAGMSDSEMKDPMAWGPAVAKYGQLDEELSEEYVEQVMTLVAEGAAIPLDDGGTIIVRGQGWQSGEFGRTISGLSAANTRWLPSPNHSSRGGSAVRLVVIHTCEGSYASCVSWLRQSRAGASAHYVVREDGRRVAQLVDENRKAWHIAANYRSWLNGGKLSGRNGQSTNTFSIGIEHGGRASQRRWPSRQIDRSVALVRNITRRHNIPRDRYHIVGHGKLQPENRYDPGPNWPWSSYLRRIRGTTQTVRVDNTNSARFRASGSWDASSWASGKIGRNYRYRRPASTTDNAKYKVRLPTGGRWQVYVRSPGNGYNTRIRYVVHHRGGRQVVARNMQNRGAAWVSLGTFRFDKGDAWRVEVASRTNGTGFIIADAVKFVKR